MLQVGQAFHNMQTTTSVNLIGVVLTMIHLRPQQYVTLQQLYNVSNTGYMTRRIPT